MPQVMVRDSWDAEQSASSRHGLLTFAHAANGVLRGMPLVREAFQQRPHIRNDWNVACRGRAIGLSVLGVVDNDKPTLKIHVCPPDLAGLGKPASREGEKTNQVCAMMRLPSSACVDFIEHLLELVRLWQLQLLRFNAKPFHVLRRVVHANYAGAFQDAPQRAECVVEILFVNLPGESSRPLFAFGL